MLTKDIFERAVNHHFVTLQQVKELWFEISEAVNLIHKSIQNEGNFFLCGNGGSAADCQHIAAEFTGRFVRERRGLRAISLTTDTSAITSISNDFGYEKVFARQLEALGRNGDILLCISTSGTSKNVVEAAECARLLNITTISLTGNEGGPLRKISDLNINVDCQDTARIQEMHILIGHIICEYIDFLFDNAGNGND